MASFKKRVKQIARTEKDVDKVLRAARLTRHPIDHRYTNMVMEWVFAIIIVVGMFAMFITMMVLTAR